MRALYVASAQGEPDPAATEELAAAQPDLDLHVVAGAAAALVEIRSAGGYRAAFLSPMLPHNEALALIATLRRDRAAIAVVAIVPEDARQFLAPAITAGADDVLVMRGTALPGVDDTLRRIRSSRHFEHAPGDPPLRVLYVGGDEAAWDQLINMPFVRAEHVVPDRDGAVPITATESMGGPPDVCVVDDQTGDVHALQVVKWLNAHAPELPIVILTAPAGGDVGGAALEFGASDVVNKTGTYRRRLMATLHRHFHRVLSPHPGSSGAPSAEGAAEARAQAEEIERLRAALAKAESRLSDLAAEARAVTDALDVERQTHAEAHETQAFERALRDRDREELSELQQALADERERRIVLEGTLRQTEDQVKSQLEAAEVRHAEGRRELETKLASAADRLHHVASQTQVLQSELQHEITGQAALHDRLTHSDIVGYALLSLEGELVEANASFARIFGFESVDAAVEAFADRSLELLADHVHVVQELEAGVPIRRVESVVRNADGRAFRVLTSAALVREAGRPLSVERLFVDLTDREELAERLRLARRLEAAGRLTAEMSDELQHLLPAFVDANSASADRQRGATLVEQLVSFTRRQGKASGLLSLRDAVQRAEPVLRQLAGDGISLHLELTDVGAIPAGEDDVEQLAAAMVFQAASSLPYGGSLRVRTDLVRSGFDEHVELSVQAGGYGAHTAAVSSTLARLVTRCGGSIQVLDDSGRTTSLLVHLPR